jgi:hypothetical protein
MKVLPVEPLSKSAKSLLPVSIVAFVLIKLERFIFFTTKI